ncbi:MAG: SDR family oxidoreductase [Defluviitaleaceae bacterium]|nr:SDR family oxidoreductase [Defluviitaleaceae bacterium]
MKNSTIRLDGQKVLITGVSRPLGIGATLARRFAEAGAIVAIHGFAKYDLTVGEKNSATPDGTMTLAKQLADSGLNVVAVTPSDFTKAGTARMAVDEAVQTLRGLDGLVLNHCYGTTLQMGEWTEENLDPHFSVNIRACMLMIQAFAGQADTTKDNAITLFTSGQANGPMINEIPYCVAKEAVSNLCRQSIVDLGKRNIRINCINPGPNDTGYYPGDTSRWCTPNDAADLVLFLHSSYAKCITGQIIASDKGEGFGGNFVL